MPLPNAFPLFVDPAMRDSGIVVFIGTVASGVVTKVDGLCTCGDFSSGVAAITFPACKRAISFNGSEDNGTATASDVHRLYITDIDAEAGTANLRTSLSTDGTDTEAPEDGTFTFALLISW